MRLARATACYDERTLAPPPTPGSSSASIDFSDATTANEVLITLLGSLFPSSTGELRAFLATHYPEVNREVSERAPIRHAVATTATKLIEREQVDAALWERLKRGRSRDADIDAAARRFEELYEEGEIGVPPPWQQWLTIHGRTVALVAVAVAVSAMAIILGLQCGDGPGPSESGSGSGSGSDVRVKEEVVVLAGRVEGLGVCTARIQVPGHGEAEVDGFRFQVKLRDVRADEEVVHAALYVNDEPAIERDVPREEWDHVVFQINPGCKGSYGVSGRVSRDPPGTSFLAPTPLENARVLVVSVPRDDYSDNRGQFKLWGLSDAIKRPELVFRVYPPDEEGGVYVTETVDQSIWDTDPSGPFVELDLPAHPDKVPKRGEMILAMHVLAPPVEPIPLVPAFISKDGKLKSVDPSVPDPTKLAPVEGVLASTAIVRAGRGTKSATGLLVGPRTVLTSGHIAKSFGKGITVSFVDGPGAAAKSRTVAVVGKPELHPLWDVALLELASAPPKDVAPIKLLAEPPESMSGRAVALIGYPSPGRSGHDASYLEVFDRTKGARRTTLGKTVGLAKVKDGDDAQRVVVHNAFSSEGSSGGALVDVKTGLVLGVQFGNRDGQTGFAVPSWALYRDPTVRSVADDFRKMDGKWAGGTVVRKVAHDPDYDNRTGYDPEFLGIGLPLPKVLESDGGTALDYEHFSVVKQSEGRLPLFVAANVDARKKVRRPEPGRDYSPGGLAGVDPTRPRTWLLDPRIQIDEQLTPRWLMHHGDQLERGTMAGPALVAWGKSYQELRRANGDTYHLTNVIPRPKGIGTWSEIEKRIVALASDRRVTVMLGPLFGDEDPKLDGLRIPRRLWVVVVDVDAGKVRTVAMVVNQTVPKPTLPTLTHRRAPTVRPVSVIGLDKLQAAIGLLKFPKVLHDSQTKKHPLIETPATVPGIRAVPRSNP